MVTKRKTTTTTKKKSLTAKQEAERERLERSLERNRERLASKLNVAGAPLSDVQLEALKEIARQQQEKLDEILSLL